MSRPASWVLLHLLAFSVGRRHGALLQRQQSLEPASAPGPPTSTALTSSTSAGYELVLRCFQPEGQDREWMGHSGNHRSAKRPALQHHRLHRRSRKHFL
jgi:hypothetical protein